MTAQAHDLPSTGSEVFKALGDPIRLDMVRQIAAAGELAWSALEVELPVSKPTVSYHIKALVQASLVVARKDGRNFYYSLRSDTLARMLDDLRALASQSAAVAEPADPVGPVRTAVGSEQPASREGPIRHTVGAPAAPESTGDLLTW